ncbi:Crp/Fnr family transcriptional regulator [Ornithinibacillus halophilus]|uniref:cAMP-binding domain of CRP or a regulatory subunit of cAMP-dependent protein kinases n=1 Tax=Ornithinibacillus halophilus TaxID=930117 RepID=A0A1M5JAR3_9BACI|nr:Crp/Fnr family transcriptional regulator [Ornithinibacillus halophilus]SHG37399.1 cAMP-binding domain of CRP or a regulatory subunit of cAMP-dependent protein kinases [Ornithinibacillus halophilus]
MLLKNKFLQLPHQIEKLQRGQVIYHQGSKIDKVGFILEGVLKCANYTNSGDEVNPHYFYEGDIFPEYLLLAGESEYIYTLVAEKRSTVILVDFQWFKNVIFSDIEWCQILIGCLAKRGLMAEKWKLCNCYGDLRTKIAYMLLEIYGVSDEDWTELKDNQRIISSKLEVSRTAYNQEMCKLEKENVIERNKSKIKIVNRAKLEAYL